MTQYLDYSYYWGDYMINNVKSWIAGLTEIGLMLIALAIALSILIGPNLPFFGSAVDNIIRLVTSLGNSGLAGLITIGVILWLFNKRTLS